VYRYANAAIAKIGLDAVLRFKSDTHLAPPSRLDRPEVVIMSQVFPSQDGSPREAGQRDAVTSEADPLFHARRSEAQPR
jgi:hypothetical protein